MALDQAQCEFLGAWERTDEIRQVVEELRFEREEINHVGQRIRRSFGGEA